MYPPQAEPTSRAPIVIARVMCGLVLVAWVGLLTFVSTPAFLGLFIPLLLPPIGCAGYLMVPWLHSKLGLTLTAIVLASLGLISVPIVYLLALLSHLGPVH
jgi:hypothetical protein